MTGPDVGVARLAYSAEELGDAIGVGRSTILALIAERELWTVRVRRRVLIPIASWNEYVERHRYPRDEKSAGVR